MSTPTSPQQLRYVLLAETGAGYIAQPHGGHDIFYDEAAGLLHIVEGRMVSAVTLPGRDDVFAATENTSAPLSPTPLLSSSLLASPSSTPGSQLRQEHASPALDHSLVKRRSTSDASSITSTTTAITATLSRAFLVSAGPNPITAVRASLDGNFTALQRSKLQIEFLDHSTGNMFIETPQQSIRSAGATVVGFFWTDAPDAEFVMVTSMGLELYSPGSQGLKYTAFQRLTAVQWFLYSYSTRILVLGCSTSGAKVQAFQFSRYNGVMRLPMLDLTPPWGSPIKSFSNQTSPAAASVSASSSSSPWLLVSQKQIWVVSLYRRVFIAYHDLSSNTLKLYRVYRDGTALFAELPLSSTSTSSGGYVPGPDLIELSVVEDLIVVHYVAPPPQQHYSNNGSSGGGGGSSNNSNRGTVALLFDIAAAAVEMTGGSAEVRSINPIVSTPTHLGLILLPDQEQQEGDGGVEIEVEEKLRFFYPDLAVDQSSGRIFRLQIDLLALSEACFSPLSSYSSSAASAEIPSLLGFLRRRQQRSSRGSSEFSISRDPRHVILHVLRRMMHDRAAPAALRSAFDAVLQQQQPQKYYNTSNEARDDYELHVKEIALGILAPALQLTSPRTSGPTQLPPTNVAAHYVLAAVSELLSSCYATGKYPVHADVASVYLTAYSYAGREYLLPCILQGHSQLLDSEELAERLAAGEVLLLLLADGASNSTSSIFLKKLALDMWKRLGNHKKVCNLLLRQGDVLAAVKHARQFLESVDLNDDTIFQVAYTTLDTTTTTIGENGTDEDNAALKAALERFLDDQKTKLSYSSHRHHPSISSSSSVDALAASPTDFLDQQTVSLVEALEKF
jgi:hypothetical protein